MAQRRHEEASDLPRLLAAYLRRSAPSLVGDAEPTLSKFSHGQSNPTFRVGDSVVLRMKPAGALPSSAHAVEREYEIQSALSGRIPVPRMILLERSASHLGTPFYLMEFVRGIVFLDATLPKLSIPERRAVYRSAVSTLGALHRIDPDAVGLASYGPSSNYYARQLRRLASVSQAQSEAAPPLHRFGDAVAWLSARLPTPELRIIHGDFKLDNLLFSIPPPDGARERQAALGPLKVSTPVLSAPPTPQYEVAAVLDWELSTLGHPMADVANFCLMYFLPSGVGQGLGGLSGLLGEDVGLDATGVPTEDEVLRMYCTSAGRSYPEPQWPFFKAFSLLRMAVIAQGVAARAAKGTASDLRATTHAAAAGAALLMELSFGVMEMADSDSARPRL